MSRTATAWKRIEAWLESHAHEVAQTLRPPVTEGEWSRAAQVWEGTLPDALHQFYRLHNGGSAAIAGEDWFSVTEAMREREIWLALIPECEQVVVQPKTWFPIAGSGDRTYALDLDTGVVWRSGGVDHAVRFAGSLHDFLEQLAQDLEADRYIVDATEGILHRDYEEPGPVGQRPELDADTGLSHRLLALAEMRRPLVSEDLAPLTQAATEDLVAAFAQPEIAEDVGARMRTVAIVAAGIGHRDPVWARAQLNDDTLGEHRFDVARLCLDADEAVEWAWRQPRTNGRDISSFARLALPELLARIETSRDELQARMEWSAVVHSCHIAWPRIKRWLESGGVLQRIALDALAWPFRNSPPLEPIGVASEELRKSLAAILDHESTPRAKRAVRDILAGLGA